ncbi:UDP-glucuronosyltransferase 1-9-like isoform X1 [Dendronephthya gigantea]|uniref:UDP-glucuronosyltransferase 1-9-like isoform X1 n=1 Tax=Dendronephthya gigantea TaxID=151771 RepID=UPI00106CCD90|nr:UDP-glucuronosyltransferase 1-9-like isoform X1 [Dendronephthya gigantea]
MARFTTKTLILLVVISAVAKYCFAANILILSLPFYSHLVGIAKVGKYLQSEGHDVRIAIPPQLEEKLQDYGIKPLLYHCLGEYQEKSLTQKTIWKMIFEKPPLLPVIFSGVQRPPNRVASKIVLDAKLRQNIKTFKPDLILLDSTPLAVMLTLIPYKLNIPFVMFGCAALPQYTRAPILPTVIPFKYSTYTDQMTFLERVSNTLMNLAFYRRSSFINQSLIKEYLPDEPYISPSDLQAKAQLWIVQRHSMMNYNPPSMPNVKRLPHLLDLTPKPLPQEYLSFLENADNGVVLVSFGSVLSSMPAQVKDKLLQAFGQTKYKFITQSSLQQKNQSDKFMSRKWLPQFDLLRHKKTKLFITHCGANGLQEALTAGVPIIGFPVFGDQPYNAVNMEKNGFGLKLDIKSFSVDELVSAIEEVVTNPSYKSKVEKASAIFQSERVPPIEEAAYWINHVLKFGGDHLRSYAQDIPLWKYLGLDIIAFCLFLWHVVVYLVITLLRCCLSRCCGSKQKLKDE